MEEVVSNLSESMNERKDLFFTSRGELRASSAGLFSLPVLRPSSPVSRLLDVLVT